MKKNIPNILSLSRIALAPVIASLMFAQNIYAAICLFILAIIAELTDALDGYTARKYNVVSDMGKVLDPFADTVLHLTIFTGFLIIGYMPFWMFLISLYRDMLSMFVRIVGGLRGFAVAAKLSGKLKTASRALAVFIIFFMNILKNYGIHLNIEKIAYYILLIVTGITVYSFFDYIQLLKKK